jgi:superfamily II DNA/RNA helicase
MEPSVEEGLLILNQILKLSNRILQKLKNNAFQVIMTSPEMCLEHTETRELLSSSDFSKDIIGFIVDEAHCISQWGGDFRKPYGMLDRLRAFVTSCTPFLATSATITPAAFGEIVGKLNIDIEKSFYLNLGNDRPNVTPSVLQMNNQKDFEALKNLVAAGVESPDDLTKTIIFTNSIRLTMQIRRYLREILPPSCHSYVDAFHALRAPKAKHRVMKNFRAGDVKVLVATEAAGMVRSAFLMQIQWDSPFDRALISLISNLSSSSAYHPLSKFGSNARVEPVVPLVFKLVLFCWWKNPCFDERSQSLRVAREILRTILMVMKKMARSWMTLVIVMRE